MTTKNIHIYVYYNLVNECSNTSLVPCDKEKMNFTHKYANIYFYENQEIKKISTREITIITDVDSVKNILKDPKTILNKYGEFVDYDENLLSSYVYEDITHNKTPIDYKPVEIESFYYVKCVFLEEMTNEIKKFISNN